MHTNCVVVFCFDFIIYLLAIIPYLTFFLNKPESADFFTGITSPSPFAQQRSVSNRKILLEKSTYQCSMVDGTLCHIIKLNYLHNKLKL